MQLASGAPLAQPSPEQGNGALSDPVSLAVVEVQVRHRGHGGQL